MQKHEFQVALVRALVAEAKRRGLGKDETRAHIMYSLLVASQKYRAKRNYVHAQWVLDLRRLVETVSNFRELMDTLLRPTDPTPASNTGVTEPPARVPLEYFTMGK